MGLELQLFDDAPNTPIEQANGSFYNKLPPRERIAQPAGVWHTLEISCQGSQVRVLIDRHVVQNVDFTKEPKLADRPLEGFLSLQNHGHEIEFRNVRLRVVR